MLAVNKLVLILILLIVLAASVYLLLILGKGNADAMIFQNELRNCCGAYRASECIDTTIFCDTHSIEQLTTLLNFDKTQLDLFCLCSTVK